MWGGVRGNREKPGGDAYSRGWAWCGGEMERHLRVKSLASSMRCFKEVRARAGNESRALTES